MKIVHFQNLFTKLGNVFMVACLLALNTGSVQVVQAATMINNSNGAERYSSSSLTFTDCITQTQIPEAECNALVALYNSTDGANWTDHTGWLQTDTPCSWYGLTCTAGHVSELNQSFNNLSGSIPASLGNLTDLTNLDLSVNSLTGSIPVELGNLTNLISLNLGTNLGLSGSIPVELGNLTSLQYLRLYSTNLTGGIPSQLGSLNNLKQLNLAYSQLSGSIPPQLGNLTSLTELQLTGNHLTNSIPVELGSLTNLTDLDLSSGNQLTGSIPPQLGNLTNLTHLGLSQNPLTGSIPPELGNLTKLVGLYIFGTQLTGSIPAVLGNLTDLHYLYLDSNQLTGRVPTELGNLTKVEILLLGNNNLSGEIPASITNLTSLTTLSLSCGLFSTNPSVVTFIDGVAPGWQNNTCPVISSITRIDPSPTSLSGVNFTVSFSEAVTGVSTSAPFNAFALTTTGVTGASISGVTPVSSALYTVTVNTGSGNGTIRLDVVDDDSIIDSQGHPLGGVGLGNGDYTSGEIYSIIQIAISGNAGVAGATLSYTDDSPKTATADGSGNYSFLVSYNWSGTVIPSKPGYTFSPANRTYSDLISDQIDQNYTPTAVTHIISGNAGVAGATLSYTDGSPKTATADGSGNYSFSVSYNWSGIVTPSKTGYTFSPINTTYSNVLSNQTSQNYAATAITYTISGNAGIAGATLSYTDGSLKTATANGSGIYSFAVSYNWSGTVTPSKAGYSFSPVDKTYSDVLSDQTAQNYIATSITYTISGNAGAAGTTLSYTDGSPKTATADSSGIYSFTVSYNWSGPVTPSKTAYTFSPVNRTYSNLTSNQTAQNYIATHIPAPSAEFDAYPTSVNAQSPVSFHIVNTSNMTTCSWNYGDGSGPGTTCNPYHDHTYTAPGFYTVTLTVSGPGGSNSLTRPNYITVHPTLTVSKTGNGSGTVTSDPAAINCGLNCSGNFGYNSSVTLSAAAAAGSAFIGWSGGGCSGTAPCTVKLTTAITVTARFEIIVASCPSITDWKGEYWVNPSFSGSPVLCRNDADLNFDWGTGSPDPLIPANSFSIQWTRTINFVEGDYVFHMGHDDGARLFIDDMDHPVLDKWTTCCVLDPSGPISLSGGNHVIRMQYFENSGAANARLWWEKLSPSVKSILSSDPNPTGAASVHFNVTFSEPVTGVSTGDPFSDFALTTSDVTSAAITGVSGAGKSYTVTVKTGFGNGTIRLDVVDDNTIIDSAGNPLGGADMGDGNFTTGGEYTITKDSAALLKCAAFSPYVKGYDPNKGIHPPNTVIDQLLDMIVKQNKYNCIMTYGVTSPLDHVFQAAQDRGLKVFANIWLEPGAANASKNNASIEDGIHAALTYPDTIVRLSCGVEVVTKAINRNLPNPVSTAETTITDCITRLHDAHVSQPITSIESWWQWCSANGACSTQWSTLANQVDWIGVNVYPWWDGKYSNICTPAANAAIYTIGRVQQVKALYPTREVVITEFGWPAGPEGYRLKNTIGQYCDTAGKAHQDLVISETQAALDDAALQGVAFEAFREPWKTGEGVFGPYWGIMNYIAAPTLKSPLINGAVRGTPTYTWLATATAVRYQFEYDDSSDCKSPIYTSAELTTVSHKPPTQALGDYYWHVQAKNNLGNWSAWSECRSVHILPVIPVAPLLLSPINAAITNDSTPTFAWGSVPNGNIYEFQLDNSSTFTLPLVQSNSGLPGGLTYTATPLADGIYYWRIRAINVNSEPGKWSTSRKIVVDTISPLPPVPLAPLDGVTVRGTPSFSWRTTATASKYQFAYDDNSDCSGPLHTSLELATTSYKPPLMPVGTFWWCVRARDLASNWSAWSASRTLTIQPVIPVAPALASPVNGLVTNDTTPTLMWNSVPYGNTYQVQVATNSTFTQNLQTLTTGAGELSLTLGTLTNGKYYWRVRAINVNAETGVWSAARYFTIKLP